MSKYSTSPITRAPRLSRRRVIRHYLYPIFLVAVITLLAIISRDLGIDAPWPHLWWVVAFILIIVDDLAGQESLFLNILYYLSELLGAGPFLRSGLQNELRVYNRRPDPPFFKYRLNLRWFISIVFLFVIWVFAVAIGQRGQLPSDVHRALIVAFLLIFGVIPYGVTFVSPVVYSRKFGEVSSLFLAGASFVVAFLSLKPILSGGDWRDAALGSIFVGLVYIGVLFSQRLWGTERAINDVITQFGNRLLMSNHEGEDYGFVPELINYALRHECAYFLEATPDGQTLVVRWCNDQEKEVQGRQVPIDNSISGRAFQTRETVVWNNIDDCTYRYSLGLENARSEIAVPILHRGEIYGVLNVQSKRIGVFEPEDAQVLETIAGMLGSARAFDLQQALLRAAVNLWDRLAEATRFEFSDEANAFELIADFAEKELGAEAIVYFPLSLSGRPCLKPFTRGLLYPERMSAPLEDEASWLIELIGAWKPHPQHYSKDESSRDQPSGSFVSRESIQSAFFVPIGRRQERLGALFLNFRHHYDFDTLFKFTVLSLAQALAELMAELRYRELYSSGFGRPAMNIHTLVNRYRGKDPSFRAKAEAIYSDVSCPLTHGCPVVELFDQVDEAFRDLSLLESAVPPSFWGSSLSDELDRYNASLSPGTSGPPPRLTHHIDVRIEQESPGLRLALYRIITEAANNSITHGKASLIEVRVERLERSLQAIITNEGIPPRPDAENNAPSRNGIYALLAMCRDQLGATIFPPSHLDGQTTVKLTIPVLPLVVSGRSRTS